MRSHDNPCMLHLTQLISLPTDPCLIVLSDSKKLAIKIRFVKIMSKNFIRDINIDVTCVLNLRLYVT